MIEIVVVTSESRPTTDPSFVYTIKENFGAIPGSKSYQLPLRKVYVDAGNMWYD